MLLLAILTIPALAANLAVAAPTITQTTTRGSIDNVLVEVSNSQVKFNIPVAPGVISVPSVITSLQPLVAPILSSSQSPSQLPLITVTITKALSTVTLSATPATITDYITIASSKSSIPPVPTMGPIASKKTWTIPSNLTDLSPFNISAFPGGQKNLKIVAGIPPAVREMSISSQSGSSSPDSTWDNSSVIQLRYPAHSVNPATKPQGGAEFYASPIPLTTSRNVTLKYCVFFPLNFDWVLAGKLPGLYGGHTGCSGGNPAFNCFSTRLMWRADGVGELYLYAPKAKQTAALCSDPQSTCDETYGISVGRGSFNWTAGNWTTVEQTVFLNTPGQPDGSFTLKVNGKEAIHRNDIFYREKSAPHLPTKPAKPAAGGSGGLLGPLLGSIGDLLGSHRRDFSVPIVLPDIPPQHRLQGMNPGVNTTTTVTLTASMAQETTALAAQGYTGLEEKFRIGGPIGFIGIFFSTFFGGHGTQYATPRDQYVWFKDFAMSDNTG